MFDEVKVIIFVVDASSFNLMLREDPTNNRLEETMKLFDKVLKSK